jgi:hypothetical protein
VCSLCGTTGPGAQATLSAALDKSWAAQHVPVNDDGCGRAPRAANGSKFLPSKCHVAGHCLCTPQGKLLKRFRDSVHKLIKRVYTTISGSRVQLEEGFVVLRLRGVPRGAMLGDNYDADSDESALCEDEYTFSHISDLLLSPYLPTFNPMLCAEVEHLAKLPDNIELQVTARPPSFSGC